MYFRAVQVSNNTYLANASGLYINEHHHSIKQHYHYLHSISIYVIAKPQKKQWLSV